MPCCNAGLALKEDYERALKFEALSYARLIAHKGRHKRVKQSERGLQYMQLVNDVARRYAKGDVEALD